MTTHGRGGLGRLIFGSVAVHMLKSATCPILLVRVAEDQAGT
jgi:nucleotide-binding universal stress UspA family protein